MDREQLNNLLNLSAIALQDYEKLFEEINRAIASDSHETKFRLLEKVSPRLALSDIASVRDLSLVIDEYLGRQYAEWEF